MNNVNDIHIDKNPHIDIRYTYRPLDIQVKKQKKQNLNDIKKWLKHPDLSWLQHPRIVKNNTKNFDGATKNKKLKDINLIVKQKKKKYKSSRNKIQLPSLREKVIFTKWFFKKFGILLVIISLLLIWDKFIIEHRLKSGYEKIISLKQTNWDIEKITQTINDAKLDFIISDILFKPFLLIPNQDIKNAYQLLIGWKKISYMLDESLQSYFATLQFINKKGWIENIALTNLFYNMKDDFRTIMWLLYDVIVTYDKVDDLWSAELNNKLRDAKEKLNNTYSYLDILNQNYDTLLNLFWHESERKYLVLFQNNDEIRATGWFIWSLATVTLHKWQVTSFVKDDVYAYEWEINKVFTEKQPAPEWLNKITETFGLRDANYFVDFWKSSQNINFFLEKIGKQVDGIIYINQNTFLDFLDHTWWIHFDTLWETLTSENFSLIISTLVESQSFKVWTLWSPKQILFDFANVFLDRLKQEKNYSAYADILLKNIQTRDLVVYSFHSEENNLLWKLWINGKINYKDTLDYSYPVFTSIWWNKSDRYIQIRYEKEIEENADCSIDTKLSIYRTHYFSKFEEQKVNELLDKHPLKDKTRQDVINIQWKGTNKSFVRVLLPEWVDVQEQPGLKIYNYPSTTVVEYYSDTRLLESTHFDLIYKIPNKECKPYSYKLYKQPGIKKYDFEYFNINTNIKKRKPAIRWDYTLD